MNHLQDGDAVLRRMYHRSVRLNLIGTLTVMINTVVDGMIIGHFLGGQAMAAFGLIIPLYSLLSLIPVLLRTATQMQIGMLVGRGDMDGARKTLFVLLSGGPFHR